MELREVVAVLRHDEDDYAAALPVLADVPALVDEARAAGGAVTLEDEVTAVDCPPAIGRTAYRVVQEGLTNARKHAAGHPVRVALTGAPGDRLTVRVRNSIAGASPRADSGGHGLVGLTERVRLVGGELDQRPGTRHLRDRGAAAMAGMSPIRVLLVDDDPLVREGLAMMLDGAGEITVVGQAGDGDEIPRRRPAPPRSTSC